MGFSRRRANRQRKAQAEQLAILLSEIAARQAGTPTARIEMQLRKQFAAAPVGSAVAAFVPDCEAARTHAIPTAFHARVAGIADTEHQEI